MAERSAGGGQPPNRELASAYSPVVRGYLLAAACYYLLISLSHPFYETGLNLPILESLALAAAGAGLFWWRRLKRQAPSLARLEAAALTINILFLANIVAYQLIHFEPLKLVYFVLLAVAFATSAPSRRVAYACTGAALVSLLLLARRAPGDLVASYGFLSIASAFCAIGMATLMRGAILRELKARLASDALNAKLENELAENRRLQAATQDLAAAAQAANRAKSEFLATISHEIRTPLNGVLGMAQAMDRGDLPEPQRERLGVVLSSARTLIEVVNDVLDISKIEAGKMELAAAPFDLIRFAEATRRLYESLAAEKGVTFGFVVEPSAEGWRHGDEVRLRQVVGNLVSNAVKFTDAGAIEVVVSGSAQGLAFRVRDTGVGIALGQQARIFEKFVQGDATTTRRAGGTGLGLAICRELVTLMGGEIGFESEAGRGTCFTFDVLMPVAAAQEATGLGGGAGDIFGELRVLVVDDNSTNRMVLQTLLSHIGVASETACDGREAVNAWERGAWDAILMDIHMPEMDGLEASREIRAREAATGRPRTPIIAVTASVLAHETEGYFAAGMDSLIAKPIEVRRLMEVIEASLAAPKITATGPAAALA